MRTRERPDADGRFSVAVGVNPVDQTVIDTEGASIRAFDIGNLGNATGGQVAVPPQLLDIKARDVGQIFGLAFDTGAANGVPNLYAAATSKFGLQIVGGSDAKGVPTRLKTGSPGAKFMDGQFGGLAGAGPGSVYKLDGATGSVSVFANIANTGPALGGIAIDAKSRSLYVSDLDSGIIHRFALDTADAAPATSGAAMFDHGVSARPAQKLEAIADDNRKLDLSSAAFKPADPATWGVTQAERRVEALAVHDGRLFYGVASGPEIWSVGLAADGTFASDARLEAPIKTEHAGSAITSLDFDANGRMIVALRGETRSPYDYQRFVDAESGDVLRLSLEQPNDPSTPGLWSAQPESYAIGSAAGHHGASGGVALGAAYDAHGAADRNRCTGSVIATGDALNVANATSVNGTAIVPGDAVRPATTATALVEFDSRQNDAGLSGHVGGVAVLRRLSASPAVEHVAVLLSPTGKRCRGVRPACVPSAARADRCSSPTGAPTRRAAAPPRPPGAAGRCGSSVHVWLCPPVQGWSRSVRLRFPWSQRPLSSDQSGRYSFSSQMSAAGPTKRRRSCMAGAK